MSKKLLLVLLDRLVLLATNTRIKAHPAKQDVIRVDKKRGNPKMNHP